MQKIHVLLKKEELDAQRLEGKVVVVLDILFATSSIVTALAHGATEVIPALDGCAAQEAAKAYPAGSYVLSGELNADTLPGFVHPTPKALLAEGIAGRRLIYCTTNGTVALAKSKGAAHVYAAALLNGRAVVEHIVANHPESTILIVCSGSADNFNLEDFYGAGYLVSLFRHRVARPRSGIPSVQSPSAVPGDTAAHNSSGSGLGLSIVKRIAELHGGKIDIAAASSGKGVSLVVSLPLVVGRGAEGATR